MNVSLLSKLPSLLPLTYSEYFSPLMFTKLVVKFSLLFLVLVYNIMLTQETQMKRNILERLKVKNEHSDAREMQMKLKPVSHWYLTNTNKNAKKLRC